MPNGSIVGVQEVNDTSATATVEIQGISGNQLLGSLQIDVQDSNFQSRQTPLISSGTVMAAVMNATLALSSDICPNFALAAKALILSLNGKKLAFQNQTTELAWYACQYGYIVDVNTRFNRYMVTGAWVAFAIGLLGSILALITLSRKEYTNCVTMIYFKAVNTIEIFNALLTLQTAMQGKYGSQLMKYEAWAFFSANVAEKLRNVLLIWVNLIVLWVAIERVIACLIVRRFHVINRKPVAVVIIVGAFLLSLAVFLPNGFAVDYAFDNSTASYRIVASNWAKSPTGGYPIYSLILSILTISFAGILFATSVTALIGLASMSKRKRALASSSGKSQGSSELLKQCSQNIQLSILQMCETVPCVLNVFLFSYVTVRYVFVAPLGDVTTAPRTMTYEAATANANMTIVVLYLLMPESEDQFFGSSNQKEGLGPNEYQINERID